MSNTSPEWDDKDFYTYRIEEINKKIEEVKKEIWEKKNF